MPVYAEGEQGWGRYCAFFGMRPERIRRDGFSELRWIRLGPAQGPDRAGDGPCGGVGVMGRSGQYAQVDRAEQAVQQFVPD